MDTTRETAAAQRFTAGPADAGERLDRWLTRRMPELSRSRVQALIRDGHARAVDASRLEPSQKVRPGLTVDVTLPPPSAVRIEAEAIPLNVVYEDADIIVVNKPPGLVVHPAPGHATGTLVNGLLHHCRDLAGIGSELRPGIVHRLDRDTSGLIVVAKTDAAMQSLGRQFRRRTVVKRYAAVVHGCPRVARGVIDAPIGRNPTDRKRMSTRARKGREALTTYRVVAVVGPCSLVRLRIATGRTHQIRVHMAYAGHPVAGDGPYGRPALDAPLSPRPARQMLHAESLEIEHPVTGRRMRFTAPWPEDFRRLLHALRDAARASGPAKPVGRPAAAPGR